MEDDSKEDSLQTPMNGEIGTEADCENHITIEKLSQEAQEANDRELLLGEDPTVKSSIEDAEKTINTMTRKRIQILKIIQDRESEQRLLTWKLEDADSRVLWFKNDAMKKKNRLEYLKLSLDKLNLTNKAHQDKAVKTFILDDEEINFRNLHCGMLHKTDSLAAEKRLLREANRRQQKGRPVDQCSALKRLDDDIWNLTLQTYTQRFDMDKGCWYFHKVTHTKCLKEMKLLKLKRENAIMNAAVKGPIWNSFGLKKQIKQETNVTEKELNKLTETHLLSHRFKIMKTKKKLRAIEKEISSLKKECLAANKRKGRAFRRILKLKEEQDAKFQQQIASSSSIFASSSS